MEVNPYEPSSTPPDTTQPAVPHSKSIREEAWRGFRFGFKMGGAAISIIIGIGLMFIFIGWIIALYRFGFGNFPFERILEAARGLGGTLLMVFIFASMSGLMGGLIMGTAALLRKFLK